MFSKRKRLIVNAYLTRMKRGVCAKAEPNYYLNTVTVYSCLVHLSRTVVRGTPTTPSFSQTSAKSMCCPVNSIYLIFVQGLKDIIRWPRPSMPPVVHLEKKWVLEFGKIWGLISCLLYVPAGKKRFAFRKSSNGVPLFLIPRHSATLLSEIKRSSACFQSGRDS